MAAEAARKRPNLFRRMALKALGIPFDITDPDAYRRTIEEPTASGQTVTVDSAMKLSAVFACTRLLSQTTASLPFSVFEQTSNGKAIAPQHPLHSIIHTAPNPDSTAPTFWGAVVAAMLLRGAARCERILIGDRLVGLRFLAPARLSIRYTQSRERMWVYREDNGRNRDIPESRIWTMPGFSLDGKHGCSIIRLGAESLGAAQAADKAAAGTFDRGLLPTIALTFPRTLNPQARTESRETMEALSGAANAGKPIILENESTVHSIGIDPRDAQLLESRAWSVEDICRWFGIDPAMVGHGSKVSNFGTGVEQKVIGFLMFTLGPLLRMIEMQVDKDLMPARDRTRFYSKIVIEGLLRTDSAARASFYSAMVNNGILTRDEVRELEDRPPMGGNAGVLTVQTALAPLDSIGQSSLDNQVRAAMRSWLIGPESTEAAAAASAAARTSEG